MALKISFLLAAVLIVGAYSLYVAFARDRDDVFHFLAYSDAQVPFCVAAFFFVLNQSIAERVAWTHPFYFPVIAWPAVTFFSVSSPIVESFLFRFYRYVQPGALAP